MRTSSDNASVRRRNAHKQGSSRCDQQGCNMVHLLQQVALCCTARASNNDALQAFAGERRGRSGVCACVRARRTPQHGIAARSRWRCRALRGPPAQGTRSAVFTVKAAPPPRRSYDATCSGGAGPPGNMECAACRAEDGVRRRGERTPTRPCCVRAMHRRGNDARQTRATYSISALSRRALVVCAHRPGQVPLSRGRPCRGAA